MRKQTKYRGFTLIELLIVVAIITILALIAVPNFLAAQTRAKASRVKADMRTVATAMEAYRVDWNCYPYWQSWEGVPIDRPNRIPGYLWRALTTPVAYLTSPLLDPFVPAGSRHIHVSRGGFTDGLFPHIMVGVGYLGPLDETAPRTHWLAASYGPDFQDDSQYMGDYPYTEYACPYDPTNGTVSAGDIYKHGAKPPTNFESDVNARDLGMPTGQGNFDPWW